VTLKQTRCEHFVIVCDCESVLKPKPIESIKIVYKKKKEKKKPKDDDEISHEILSRCCKTLISYGFDKEEAEQLIRKAYSIDKNADCIKLVKMAIFDFGGKNG
jgi:Holliday junction resolvasome RuvABC DNA-binding subunit